MDSFRPLRAAVLQVVHSLLVLPLNMEDAVLDPDQTHTTVLANHLR